jgi:hypothetical protein
MANVGCWPVAIMFSHFANVCFGRASEGEGAQPGCAARTDGRCDAALARVLNPTPAALAPATKSTGTAISLARAWRSKSSRFLPGGSRSAASRAACACCSNRAANDISCFTLRRRMAMAWRLPCAIRLAASRARHCPLVHVHARRRCADPVRGKPPCKSCRKSSLMHAIVRNALPDRASFKSLRLETPKARPEENLYHPGWRPRCPQKSGAAYLFSCPQSHMRHVTCARTAFVMPRERADVVGLASPGLGAFRSQIDCGIPGRPPDRLVRRPSFWGKPLSASHRRPS